METHKSMDPGNTLTVNTTVTCSASAEEAEKFIIAYHGIFKMQIEEEIDLPTQIVDAIGAVHDKVIKFINEHGLGTTKEGG